MDNSEVIFRRGHKENLPDEITDGAISIDTRQGQMYADIVEEGERKRIYLGGGMFALSDSNGPNKTIEIPGVYEYFEGLMVTVVFTDMDNADVSPMTLGINDLASVPLRSDEDTPITCVEIVKGVPYMFAIRYLYSAQAEQNVPVFVINSGNVDSRPKWKHINSMVGL